MKIIKIEKLNDTNKILTLGYRKLYPVLLTLQNWYGKKKEIKAFPTSVGPTFGGPNILYFYYCDEVGCRLDDKYEYGFSEQINNFLATTEF
jgi:hypothetical protein